jgi:hypothetical protein
LHQWFDAILPQGWPPDHEPEDENDADESRPAQRKPDGVEAPIFIGQVCRQRGLWFWRMKRAGAIYNGINAGEQRGPRPFSLQVVEISGNPAGV